MAITKKITYVRPNTDAVFPIFTGDVLATILSKRQSAIDSGKLTTNISMSSDELTKITTFTIADIDTLNQYTNSVTLAQKCPTLVEYALNEKSGLAVTRTDELTGIDQPFTVTTVYTSPEGTPITSPLGMSLDDFPSTYFGNSRDLQVCIELNDSKVIHLTTTANTLTVVHQYNDCNDFNATNWSDTYIVVALNALGITKTVQFALV